MRIITLIIFISVISILPTSAQENPTTNHAGIGGIPVFDVLNMFPENQISGAALSVNYGKIIFPNLSFGVNLYYSSVSNEYTSQSMDLHKEQQDIKVLAISPNLRYQFKLSNKFILFGQSSIGFGNYNEKTKNLSNSATINNGDENKSILMVTAGLGANYFVFKNLALELNIPYVYLNRLSSLENVDDFHTIAPMIGIQYFW